MDAIHPYLHFNGNCEEALSFYKDCFKGKIAILKRFKESPHEIPKETESLILHAEFKAGDFYFMASDVPPSNQEIAGNNVCLCLNFKSQKKQEQLFVTLAKGGEVLMPLQETFYYDRFGKLIDKYGITWMFTIQKKQS